MLGLGSPGLASVGRLDNTTLLSYRLGHLRRHNHHECNGFRGIAGLNGKGHVGQSPIEL
jgi:hypothetical protein